MLINWSSRATIQVWTFQNNFQGTCLTGQDARNYQILLVETSKADTMAVHDTIGDFITVIEMLEVPARRLVYTQTSGLESLLFYAIEVSLKKFRKPKLNRGLSTLKFISSMLTENTLFAVFHESASQEEGLIAVTIKYLEHLIGTILSTPQGIMVGNCANKLGGELICSVW